MGTNEGWPEAFGFSLVGDSPVMINEVEEGGSAQQAGLQVGDFLVELNGENIEEYSKEEVVELARKSLKVPPSLVVVSRMRELILPRSQDGGFGVTFRGNSPIFIRSVDFDSAARSAGLRSGDLLVEINNKNVRYSMKMEVLDLLKATNEKLQLKVVAGGLAPSTAVNKGKKLKKAQKQNVPEEILTERYQKARLFHSKVGYYLMGEPLKKTQLMTLLRLYSKDRDINSLGASLNILLESPTQKRLCQDIRTFIHPSHHNRFDTLVMFDPNRSLSRRSHGQDNWRGSLQWNRPLGAEEKASHMRSSLPNLSHLTGRTVQIYRGNGSFGLALSGNAPVFVRSVDRGGPSERAGIRTGDQILQINGINIRGATHSQVIQLLQASGPNPTLVVVSPPSTYAAPGYGTLPHSYVPENIAAEARRSVETFKEKMGEVLSGEERQMIMKQLSKFSKHKEIPELVNSLTWILDSPEKTVLYHYICQLLPDEAQGEFDHIAAAILAGESALSISSSTGHQPCAEPHRSLRLSSSSHSSLSSTHSNEEREVGVAEGEGGAVPIVLRQRSGGRSHTASSGSGAPRRSEEYGGRKEGFGRITGNGLRVGGEQRESVHREQQGGSFGSEAPGSGGRGGGTGGGEGGAGAGNGRGGGQQTGKGVDQKIDKSPTRQKVKMEPPLSPTKPPLQSPTKTPNSSMMSTPGAVPLPPNPPPTPATGVGGVPIPPPPPPAFSAESKSHLKRVNWEKISGAEGTIWKELSGLEEALEYFEIEEKFANQATKLGTGKKTSKPSILNERKAYNISILLGHLKLPFGKIKEAVLACDGTILSEQHLMQMEAFAPDQKECIGFARFHDDMSTLSKADRFACEMSTIPGYQQRLRAMIFKIHFKEKVDEIKPDLEAIIRASGELQSSKNLKRVLEIVLAVGNYMNAGNRRVGKAVGFRIKYLTQLKDLKTTDNKSTLLHFVAATVERKFPQVIEFSGDLKHVSAAARVSGETLEIELNELTKGLEEIQKAIEELSTQESQEDKFCDIMAEFVAWADKEITELLKSYSFMKQEFASVMKFYGEDTTKTRIDNFFSTFASFTSEFERAVKENRESREKQAKLEVKAKEKDQAMKKKGGFKLFSRSSKNMEEDIKKELQAKSSKKIDINSLEASRKTKVADSTQQQDFRHLLKKKQNPSSPTRKTFGKVGASEDEEKGKSEKRSRSRQPSTEIRVTPVRQDSRKSKTGEEKEKEKKKVDSSSTKFLKVEAKPKGGRILSSAAELTGSWDYIPSAATSAVQLNPPNEETEAEHSRHHTEETEAPVDCVQEDNFYQEAWNDTEQFEFESGFDDDDNDYVASSPPMIDLQMPPQLQHNQDRKYNPEFDFETHF